MAQNSALGPSRKLLIEKVCFKHRTRGECTGKPPVVSRPVGAGASTSPESRCIQFHTGCPLLGDNFIVLLTMAQRKKSAKIKKKKQAQMADGSHTLSGTACPVPDGQGQPEEVRRADLIAPHQLIAVRRSGLE